jgi:hypothetical protein
LSAVAALMRLGPEAGEKADEKSEKSKKKPGAAIRKKIVEAARVEGFWILPDLGIAGKEYHWDDLVVLSPSPAGTRPSQDYNASALLLEYSCALAGLSDPKDLENLKSRLDDYFSLSSDDHSRLESLSMLLLTQSNPESFTDPSNIGECLQFWLQRDQRNTIRDFLTRFLTPREKEGEAQDDDQRASLIQAVCESLDVEQNEIPLEDLPPNARLEFGLQVSTVLASLFKD